MRSLVIVVLFLAMLVTPTVVYGRLDELPQEEWGELKREDQKEPDNQKELEPDDYYCMGRTIQKKIFWVPDWCLERALPQIPTEIGQLLFCKLGYYGDANEYTIVPALPGEDKVNGWSLCADLL